MKKPVKTPEERLQHELDKLIDECDILEMAASLTDVIAQPETSREQRHHLAEVVRFLHSAARVQLDPNSRKLHKVA